MQNFWERDEVIGGQQPRSQFGRVTTGQPDPRRRQQIQQGDIDITRGEFDVRTAPRVEARAEADQRRQQMQTARLPEAVMDDLNQDVSVFSSLNRAITNFDDNYAGLGAGIENTAQGVIPGVGTEGQRQWWADFYATDNAVRNRLFGASLSEGEQAAFARTTVSPNMNAAEVRRNLAERRELARSALSRRVNALRAQGYNQEAIDALVGESAAALNTESQPGFLSDMVGGAINSQLDGRSRRPGGNPDWERELLNDPNYIGRLGGDSNAQPQTQEDPGLLHSLGVGAGAVVQGAGDLLGIVGNPLNYGINSVLGTDLSTDIGQTFRDASGLPDPMTGAESLGNAIGRAGTGALGAAGLARNVARYAPQGWNALREGLTRFGSTPGIDTAAGASSGASAELARMAGLGPVGQTVAAIGGGGMGALGASRAATRMQPPVQTPLTQAGRAEGVTVNRAMLDPSSERRVSALDRTVVGGPVVQRQLGNVGQQIEGRVRSLGRGGEVLDPITTGEMARNVAQRSIRNSGQRIGRIYDAAETASAGVRVPPTRSLQVVEDVIARLNETPQTNGAELNFLQGLRNDLANDLSVGGLRRIRTSLRQRISNGGLSFGEDEATVLSVMDAASEDIATGLTQAGRGNAARLFREADTQYRDRMEFIQGTLQQLVGRRNANLPPERIAANLRAMAGPRGNAAGFRRIVEEMEPEEQADIAATFAEALGRNNRGEFSTAQLVSQLAEQGRGSNRIPRSALLTVFGERGVKSLDNLTALAREHSRVTRATGGSPTGLANDWRSYLTNFLFSGGAGFAIDGGMTAGMVAGGTMAAKAGRDLFSARALMSPNVTNWLRQAPRTSAPAPIRRHIARLASIASREPALAPQIQQIEQTLLRAMNDNARSAVAGDEQEQRPYR